ncbi:flagellar brake protein [Propionispora vibrioides]|uniref:C-di-GMP-binding flagellar brake protein YcgR, contains PilZNR and PilZ domains n=1 Tax=Propionispora vibrioides TaxID=112903 RepID=A0A1H8SRA8_9FIRM|nr:flagellar brake domain-containing protein [Propionispora vibrioides]SEO80854.1 c-di-GMP-binding flagellar brake protein YcgR, contains PilZNR and PilZ domains [Propionispora vibrioides]
MIIFSNFLRQGGILILEEEVFKINQRLTLILPEKVSIAECYSRIEDMTPEAMTIAMPMSKGYPIIIPNGSTVWGRVVENGQVYQFQSTVTGKRISPLPVWILTLPTNITKVQQRSFVRLDIVLPVKIQVVSEQQDEDAPLHDLLTKNISGGGVCLISQDKLKLGTKLNVQLQLPEQEAWTIASDVVRLDMPQNDRQLYWIGVRFLDIAEPIRNRLIRFIFRKQLEQRQKEV